jgi:hypothetical protein
MTSRWLLLLFCACLTGHAQTSGPVTFHGTAKTYFLAVNILIHTIRSKSINCNYKYLYSQMPFYSVLYEYR